jgi:hypothetical protein
MENMFWENIAANEANGKLDQGLIYHKMGVPLLDDFVEKNV